MEKRLHPRISTEKTCTARFRVGDRTWTGEEVRDLGARGCGIRIPLADLGLLAPGAVAESLHLSHPGVPQQPVKGKVVWTRRTRHHGKEFVDAGLAFTDLPGKFVVELEAYLNYAAINSTPFIDMFGMPT